MISNSGTIGVYSGTLEVDAGGQAYNTFTNSGSLVIAAGSVVQIPNNYTQTSTGSLQPILAGPTSFGQLQVSGQVTLAGGLHVGAANNFEPTTNETFPVVSAGSTIGTFSTLSGLNFSNGISLYPVYSSTGVVLISQHLATAPAALSFAVAADASGGPQVTLDNPDGKVRSRFMAFDPSFTGGVRVATADVNGDGIPDVIVGTGPGVPTLVRLLDGVTRTELFSVHPFEPAFTGGVFVAAGDLTGDGTPDLIVTPDEGGGPRVQVYDGKTFAKVADFFGIDDPSFRGGARAAVGDLAGDGYGDVVVAAGFGGGPRVSIFDGKALSSGRFVHPVNDFFIFGGSDAVNLRNGVFIAAGDVNGDGFADLIAGGGPGGGPRVLVVDGRSLLQNGPAQLVPLANFFAGNPENRGGIRVAVKEIDGDNHADLVTGAGVGAGSTVTAYAGSAIPADGQPPVLWSADVFPGFTGGVFVG
jgi:hypothetical protein